MTRVQRPTRALVQPRPPSQSLPETSPKKQSARNETFSNVNWERVVGMPSAVPTEKKRSQRRNDTAPCRPSKRRNVGASHQERSCETPRRPSPPCGDNIQSPKEQCNENALNGLIPCDGLLQPTSLVTRPGLSIKSVLPRSRSECRSAALGSSDLSEASSPFRVCSDRDGEKSRRVGVCESRVASIGHTPDKTKKNFFRGEPRSRSMHGKSSPGQREESIEARGSGGPFSFIGDSQRNSAGVGCLSRPMSLVSSPTIGEEHAPGADMSGGDGLVAMKMTASFKSQEPKTPLRVRSSRRRRAGEHRRVRRVVEQAPPTSIELGRATPCESVKVNVVDTSTKEASGRMYRVESGNIPRYLTNTGAGPSSRPCDDDIASSVDHHARTAPGGQTVDTRLKQTPMPIESSDKAVREIREIYGGGASLGQQAQVKRCQTTPSRRSLRSNAGIKRLKFVSSPSIVIDLTQTDDTEDFSDRDSRVASKQDARVAPGSSREMRAGTVPHACGPVQVRASGPPKISELTAEEDQVVRSLTTGGSGSDKLATLPSAHITLRRADFKRLRGVRWLNDEVLNFYVAMVNERNRRYFETIEGSSKAIPTRPRTYVFNTFFYARLTQGGYDFEGVSRWSRRAQLDVLEQDLVLIPVNIGNHHWVLAGVDFRNERYLYLDSMNGRDHSSEVFENIRSWLYDEVSDKHGVARANDVGVDSWETSVNRYFEFIAQHQGTRRGMEASSSSYAKGPEKYRKPKRFKVPRQLDGGSCGVFTAKMADCLELGVKASFGHEDIKLIRSRMVLDLYNRYLPG